MTGVAVFVVQQPSLPMKVYLQESVRIAQGQVSVTFSKLQVSLVLNIVGNVWHSVSFNDKKPKILPKYITYATFKYLCI